MNGGTAAECAALAAVAAPDPLFESDRERLLTPTPLFTKLVSAAVLVLADDERANAIFDELETGAHWSGAPHALMGANIWRGFEWARRGELAEAEACLRAALEVMKLWSVSGGRMSHAFGLLADVLVERAELAAARRVLAERPDASGGEGEAVCRYAELKLLVAESRFEEALEAADAYGELFGGVVNPAWTAWRSVRAQALARLGREDAVEQLEEELGVRAPVGDRRRSWAGLTAVPCTSASDVGSNDRPSDA